MKLTYSLPLAVESNFRYIKLFKIKKSSLQSIRMQSFLICIHRALVKTALAVN